MGLRQMYFKVLFIQNLTCLVNVLIGQLVYDLDSIFNTNQLIL